MSTPSEKFLTERCPTLKVKHTKILDPNRSLTSCPFCNSKFPVVIDLTGSSSSSGTRPPADWPTGLLWPGKNSRCSSEPELVLESSDEIPPSRVIEPTQGRSSAIPTEFAQVSQAIARRSYEIPEYAHVQYTEAPRTRSRRSRDIPDYPTLPPLSQASALHVPTYRNQAPTTLMPPPGRNISFSESHVSALAAKTASLIAENTETPHNRAWVSLQTLTADKEIICDPKDGWQSFKYANLKKETWIGAKELSTMDKFPSAFALMDWLFRVFQLPHPPHTRERHFIHPHTFTQNGGTFSFFAIDNHAPITLGRLLYDILKTPVYKSSSLQKQPIIINLMHNAPGTKVDDKAGMGDDSDADGEETPVKKKRAKKEIGTSPNKRGKKGLAQGAKVDDTTPIKREPAVKEPTVKKEPGGKKELGIKKEPDVRTTDESTIQVKEEDLDSLASLSDWDVPPLKKPAPPPAISPIDMGGQIGVVQCYDMTGEDDDRPRQTSAKGRGGFGPPVTTRSAARKRSFVEYTNKSEV